MEDKNVKATIQKIVSWLSGEPNERINEWVNEDETSFQNILTLMDICATRGWRDLKLSPLEFADDKAWELARTLYTAATKFFGGGRG